MQSRIRLKVFIGAVIAIIVVVIVLLLPKKSTYVADTTTQLPSTIPVTQETSGNNTPASTVAVNPQTPSIPSTSKYKNGTYSATGSYNSPGGVDNLPVSVTLSNGIITNAMVTNGANDRTSSRYQNEFIANYKSLVIGKSINSVVLSKVSGSSLTSAGWNNAITKIKTEAVA